MSTTRLTVYDLLRITYTYEGKALEEAARVRRDSVCSVSLVCFANSRIIVLIVSRHQSPALTCRHLHPAATSMVSKQTSPSATVGRIVNEAQASRFRRLGEGERNNGATLIVPRPPSLHLSQRYSALDEMRPAFKLVHMLETTELGAHIAYSA